MSLVLIVFFTSCTKNNANLLNRNENGYEIPRDILFNGEYSSSNTPNYFQKTTIHFTRNINFYISSNICKFIRI